VIRHALVTDAKDIQNLVNIYADKGEMLHLNLQQIYEKIFEFIVYEQDGRIIGCCALHPTHEKLAEIRSLAVDSNAHRRGVGRKLVEYCLDWAKKSVFEQVFVFKHTNQSFFLRLVFQG